ncbi:phosphotransferase [Phlyctema vagabunda]|uniref:Phosphotransferase n=1 Tax=Phlyctema vagabunda TaxID=108571 RepID=A0ABR4PV04_9HELO
MYKARQDFDDVAWDQNDEAWERSLRQLRSASTCRVAESIVQQQFGKAATLVTPLIMGGYNILYKMRLDDEPDGIMVRIPCPDLVQFPYEKIVGEAAMARYLARATRVPVPRIFCHGHHPHIGPFILLQQIESSRDLSDALTTPDQPPDVTHVLNCDIPETALAQYYTKVASCLVQLSQPSFGRIGSLVETQEGNYTVAGRPITQNMNNMLQLANIPRAVFPSESQTYGTADEWYIALAEMHISQLVFQHNDIVTTEDDCRNKYLARHLFYKLARQGRLSTFGFREDTWSAQSEQQSQSLLPAPDCVDSFRIWCDDLRPANMLLNDSDDIVALIDWEFAYIAPTQFILDPPWWLLLDVPEMWSPGIDDWKEVYEKRLETWLSAMKTAEESAASTPSLPFTLSTYMRESWDTGRFWLNYAARKSWAFDTIYWKFLDERFFGARAEGTGTAAHELWQTRGHLLDARERVAMDVFVARKMAESKQRVLVDWDPTEARERLAEVLSGF